MTRTSTFPLLLTWMCAVGVWPVRDLCWSQGPWQPKVMYRSLCHTWRNLTPVRLVCVCVCVCACMCVCVHECACRCEWVCERERECVCEWERERERVSECVCACVCGALAVVSGVWAWFLTSRFSLLYATAVSLTLTDLHHLMRSRKKDQKICIIAPRNIC